jgi:hypothetical protein
MSTSPLSPEEVRAAAEVHRELGPEYDDAVVASFLEKVDRAVAARLTGPPRAQPVMPDGRRTLLKGVAIGAIVSGSVIFAAMSGNASEEERGFLVVLALWLVAAVGYALSAARTRQQPTSRRTAPGR